MAVIVKVRAIWSGFQGAPGYTNWHGLSDGDAAVAAAALAGRMRAFFNGMAVGLPLEASVKVQRTYQVLDSTNGHVTAEGTLATDPLAVAGTVAGNYSVVTGAVVNWETGLYNEDGHRIRGRTYLVPLTNVFDTHGSLNDPSIALMTTVSTAAIGGVGNLVVYSRPTSKGATDGRVSTVTAATIHDKACVLRSRRD